MPRKKKCKTCKSPFVREEHVIDTYTITVDRCGCGWTLVDVRDGGGASLNTLLDKTIIEKMLRSDKSHIKL